MLESTVLSKAKSLLKMRWSWEEPCLACRGDRLLDVKVNNDESEAEVVRLGSIRSGRANDVLVLANSTQRGTDSKSLQGIDTRGKYNPALAKDRITRYETAIWEGKQEISKTKESFKSDTELVVNACLLSFSIDSFKALPQAEANIYREHNCLGLDRNYVNSQMLLQGSRASPLSLILCSTRFFVV